MRNHKVTTHKMGEIPVCMPIVTIEFHWNFSFVRGNANLNIEIGHAIEMFQFTAAAGTNETIFQ